MNENESERVIALEADIEIWFGMSSAQPTCQIKRNRPTYHTPDCANRLSNFVHLGISII